MCLWHNDEPGDTLLLNYSSPRHHPPPLTQLLFPASLAAVLPFLPLSLSLCCALHFFTLHKIQTGPLAYVPPPHLSIKPICLLATRISAMLKLLPPLHSPSPYRVTYLFIKQMPPTQTLQCIALHLFKTVFTFLYCNCRPECI